MRAQNCDVNLIDRFYVSAELILQEGPFLCGPRRVPEAGTSGGKSISDDYYDVER